MTREFIKILREEIGAVSEADFSLCSGLLKVKWNEADGPEIKCNVLINFGVVPKAYVAGVQAEILEARVIAEGKRDHFSRLSPADQKKEKAYGREQLSAIFTRYTKQMHSPSEFMRGLLQRLTRGFNKKHGVRGTLWEDRFHSVIVQSGLTSKPMTAYIDLNPVRAGICKDPCNQIISFWWENLLLLLSGKVRGVVFPIP